MRQTADHGGDWLHSPVDGSTPSGGPMTNNEQRLGLAIFSWIVTAGMYALAIYGTFNNSWWAAAFAWVVALHCTYASLKMSTGHIQDGQDPADWWKG